MPKTLVHKLYIREGHRVAVIDAPQGYESLLGELPKNVTMEPSFPAPSTGYSTLS